MSLASAGKTSGTSGRLPIPAAYNCDSKYSEVGGLFKIIEGGFLLGTVLMFLICPTANINSVHRIPKAKISEDFV